MMVGIARLASVAFVLSATLATAQDSAPSLEWFHGNWRGEGILLGRPAQVSLTVGPTLLGRATALSYSADIAALGDQPGFKFEGRGTYRLLPDGRVIGNWSDSQGNFHPLAGRVEGQAMSVTWGEPRTEVGHSRYALEPDGTLRVTDSEENRGEMRVFATATYRRVP